MIGMTRITTRRTSIAVEISLFYRFLKTRSRSRLQSRRPLFSGHPFADVSRTMCDAYALLLTAQEEPHDLHIHEGHLR
jgi:hypothetical protein